MRKIVSEEERQKHANRKKSILTILMLIILLGSTAGYAFLSYTSTDSQNNVPTQQTGAGWPFIAGGNTLYLKNSQEGVQNISVSIYNNFGSYSGKPLYIASDNSGITSEIANTLGLYTYRVQEACYGPCTRDFPEKDCSENLIVWKQSDENKVYQNNSCIFIEGDIRAADAFIYKILSEA